MKQIMTQIWIQLKIDIRDRATLLVYYLVPLLFYFIMGAVFSSINPQITETLGASMAIFAITMGAVLGMPAPIVKLRETGALRSYRVAGIPGWSVLLAQSVSAGLHLLVVSIIIFFTAPLFYGAAWPLQPAVWFAVLLVLLLTSLSLGLLIGVAARSQSVAMMLSQAIFLPTVMFGGIMFPSDMLPPALRMAGRILPATWLMQAFSSGAYRLDTDTGTLPALMISLGIGLIAFGLAVFRQRSLVA
ncbi:MAG: ABC transporter permease [Bacillota bacterium]|nr:ABC transporter permease [Bacillota bacterium]